MANKQKNLFDDGGEAFRDLGIGRQKHNKIPDLARQESSLDLETALLL